jgi:hypothetical protein
LRSAPNGNFEHRTARRSHRRAAFLIRRARHLAAVGGGALMGNSNSKITDNIWRVGVNDKFGGSVGAR